MICAIGRSSWAISAALAISLPRTASPSTSTRTSSTRESRRAAFTTSFAYAGRNDYFVNIDGEKAGLWKGFFITLHGETRYGDTVNLDTGAIIPVNTAELFPKATGSETALTGVKFTQALSENFVTFAGKLNMLDEFKMPFTGAASSTASGTSACRFPSLWPGRCRTRLWGPEPPSCKTGARLHGDGARHQQHADHQRVQHLFRQRGDDLREPDVADEVFRPAGTARAFRHLQHRQVQRSCSRRPTSIRKRGCRSRRDSTQTPGRCSTTANQALWVNPCNPKHVYGVFTNIGTADDGPSPIRFAANVALYGSSPITTRPLDTFGVGYTFTRYSSPVQNFAPVLLPIGNDQAVETVLQLRRHALVQCRARPAGRPCRPARKRCRPTASRSTRRSCWDCERRSISERRATIAASTFIGPQRGASVSARLFACRED